MVCFVFCDFYFSDLGIFFMVPNSTSCIQTIVFTLIKPAKLGRKSAYQRVLYGFSRKKRFTVAVHAASLIQALFSFKNFCKIEIVALSFVFDKYFPIMN